MPARVLWVIKGLGPGGAETLLANAAAVHDRTAFQIECAFVLPFKDHLAERLEAAGVGTVCVSRRARDWRWPIRLARLVRAGGYHVVHVHSPLPGSVARLATRSMGRRRPRLVATEHNAWSTFRPPTRFLNRLTSRWDDVTFTVSDEVQASMRGRAARQAVTLTHGIDVQATGSLRSERVAVRAELGIPDGSFVIGTVANFREQKDYPTFLSAARLFLDAGGDATWVIVGQGPLEENTRDVARQLGLDAHVIFTGFRSDAVRLQSAFDVFTLSSKWEGLPVALMEALSLGLPVAATAVGGIAEVLVDDESALLVASGDPDALATAWRRLNDDPGLRHRLSAASTLLSKQFDAGRMQQVIESAYRDLVNGETAELNYAPGPDSSHRRPPTGPDGLDIRPLNDDDEPAVLALLGRSLGWHDDSRFRDLYRWKHVENAFGRSFGWVATAGERIVGVRLFMRWEFARGGEILHAVRAVDTATDPDYQGRGLFTALTMHGLDEVRSAGIDFVFNTPNAQSLPGYLKMGWSEVGRVAASARPARLGSVPRLLRARIPAEHWSIPVEAGSPISQWLAVNGAPGAQELDSARSIRTATGHAFLTWRYSMPHLHYRVIDSDDGAIVVRLRRRGEVRELVVATSWGLTPRLEARLAVSVARDVGADHVIRIGQVDLPGFVSSQWLGPTLTWRGVNLHAMPPSPNWALEMGDIELM